MGQRKWPNAGNIETSMGVTRVPIDLAGPLRSNGDHAQGDFYIQMATREGTLAASYNRGMRPLTGSGGVITTVVEDAMQRSLAFSFDNSREARKVRERVETDFDGIQAATETTTSSGRLTHIQHHSLGNLKYLPLSYTARDAASQNRVDKVVSAPRRRTKPPIGIAAIPRP